LDKDAAESRVDLIANEDGGSNKGGPISFDEEHYFSDTRGLLLMDGGEFVV
jgi:hypothetical protein